MGFSQGGSPRSWSRALDVDEMGAGYVTEPRLYQLTWQTAPIADRAFEIEFLDPHVDVFAFTFD